MRLRYLHLQNYPPISDIEVCFASGSPLARECAIRFVVGVNGSGKSNLLRAVAEAFLALSDLRVPSFPVSLVYELGVRGTPSHRTLLLHCPGSRKQASLWIRERFYFNHQSGQDAFNTLFEHLDEKGVPGDHGFSALIEPGSWPLRESSPPQIALPSAVLAYTTGDMRPWYSVWNRNQRADGILEGNDDVLVDERPAGWTKAQESALQAAQLASEDEVRPVQNIGGTDSDQQGRPILLNATLLKCALLAVGLPHALSDPDDSNNPLQDLLKRGGWHHLVSVAFRSHMQLSQWDQKLCETAHDWWLCASDVVTEPHPVEKRRALLFDMKGPFDSQGARFASAASGDLHTCSTQGEALWVLLGGAEDASPFDLFTRLLELNQEGLFDDVLLRIRRASVPTNDKDRTDDIGVMRYEELSDGEQMFMGRMALFHLLRGRQDSLLLLDEPETHFNDLWKRDVVSVVDDALAHTSADVLIATHAALMLTDALKDELVVLERKSPLGGVGPSQSGIRMLDAQTHTFGATGDHPLRDVFGAPDTVGRRASRLLEILVATTQFAEKMDEHWRRGDMLGDSLVNQILQTAVVTEPGLTQTHVIESIASFERFALHFGIEKPLTMRTVLEAFIRETGPGYFQVELKRAWRKLTEVANNAP